LGYRGLVLLLVSMAVPVEEAGANGKQPVPKPLTMEEKVRSSDIIFIGETVRVFFTDADRNELAAEPEIPLNAGSWLTVRVKKVLWNREAVNEGQITINHPTSGTSGSTLRGRYGGKDLIYFVRVVRSRVNVSGRTEVREVLRFTSGRWIVYPHPLEELNEVMSTIKLQQTWVTDHGGERDKK
jgi:hypothetical protein